MYKAIKVRRGRSKALVAAARKSLVAVRHILTKEVADKHATAEQVATSPFAYVYKVSMRRLPDGVSARQAGRQQLDRPSLGTDLEEFRRGNKRIYLPPSGSRLLVKTVGG